MTCFALTATMRSVYEEKCLQFIVMFTLEFYTRLNAYLVQIQSIIVINSSIL